MIVRNPFDPGQIQNGAGASDFSMLSRVMKSLLPLTAAVSITVETINLDIGASDRPGPTVRLQDPSRIS